MSPLRPTMFVDAIPELAAARTPRDETGPASSADDQPASKDGEEAEPVDAATA